MLQGSVLGPLTFIAYTEDITETIELCNVGHHLYVNDTQLQQRKTLKDFDATRSRIEQCVTGVSD